MKTKIPYCKLNYDNELQHIQALFKGDFVDNGQYVSACNDKLSTLLGGKPVLLTDSCTNALELAAILADLQPGDEVIMPSFTFVTTATAFVMRGVVPVFVDCDPHTLNINPELIESAITSKTRAIIPMHYAAIGCDMDAIMTIAKHYNLLVIEDAAQCIQSTYQGRALGTIGAFGAFSFHYTKNVHCGHGGCLIINDDQYLERAKIIWQKGTNREAFREGKVDKYSWRDIGSSYMPSELTAAFLLAQLERVDSITQERRHIWYCYHELLAKLEHSGALRRPIVPGECMHNGHIYYVLLPTANVAQELRVHLQKFGIEAVTHYVALHESEGGRKFGRASGAMNVTNDFSNRLLRLPLWVGMAQRQIDFICDQIAAFFQ